MTKAELRQDLEDSIRWTLEGIASEWGFSMDYWADSDVCSIMSDVDQYVRFLEEAEDKEN